MTSPERFRSEIELALLNLPVKTPSGRVSERVVPIQLGAPSGSHQIPPAWVYERNESNLHMVFQFYKNFSENDLLCKVMRKGQYPTSGQGASIQFNSNFCMVPDSTKVALRHHGRVTITSALSRKRLIDAMEATCSSVMKIVGIPSKPRDWPFFIGTTDKTHQLIDNIFIYAYCIEQAKRFIRKEVPFEDLILQKNLLSDGIQQ